MDTSETGQNSADHPLIGEVVPILHAVFDALPEQAVLLDRLGGIVECNAAWKEKLGTPLAAMAAPAGESDYFAICRARLPDADRSMQEVCEGVRAVLSGELATFQTEYRRKLEDGAERWFSITACPVKTDATLLLHKDVTARKLLEREILEISEYERRKMGRELHDGLCQVLGGMVLSIAVMANSLRKREAPEAGEMTRLIEIARTATEQARDLSRSLHPVELDGQGLVAALQELVKRVSGSVECKFICPHDVSIPDGATSLALYRVAQEALSNALQHANPTWVTISLLEKNRHLLLSIEDDGNGLESASISRRSMGMTIMRYRARTIGARLHLQNMEKGGAKITCILPMPS